MADLISSETLIEILSARTTKKLRTGSITVQDVRAAAEMLRETLGLDMVFAVTNIEYKYQLDHIVTCTEQGSDIDAPRHVELTKDHYADIASGYAAEPFSSEPIPELGYLNAKSQLHSGVMHDGEYYGTVGFCCMQERLWTEMDRLALEYLSLVVLFYLGLSCLKSGDRRDRRVMEKANVDHILSCYHIDLETERCHVVKLAPFLEGLIDEWMSYDDMVDMYAQKFVDPVYGTRMMETFCIDNLQRLLKAGGPGVSMELPRILDGKANWLSCSVDGLSFDETGKPVRAVATVRDITEEMQEDALLAHGLHLDRRSYAAITGIDLDTGKYAVYVDNRSVGAGAQSELQNYGDYEAVVDFMADECIDPAYADEYRYLFSIDRMRDLFGAGVWEFDLEFPCQYGGEERWVRLEAVPGPSFGSGDCKVVLYYSDITEQKRKEQQFEEIRQSLELARRHMFEKDLQLTLDPLTGAFNRSGYNEYMESIADNGESVGYLMIDIDHFKELNDTYGHKVGDEVLTQVVKMLKLTFRAEDKIFRMGGDEFVMLLSGCKSTAWESIRAKLAAIHANLKRESKYEIVVTLSAGLVISDDGFNRMMPKLADDALYLTKRNGRAGLTMVDECGDVLESWNDAEASSVERDRRAEIGKWRYERPVDGSQPPRLFFDEAARFLLGIPDSMSPEECYEQWMASLPTKHKIMLEDMQAKTVAVGQAEATHSWIHPVQGEMRVRTRVRYVGDDKMQEYTGHFVVLKKEEAVLTPDDGQFVIQAMNNACFRTYYIDLNSGEYALMKGFDSAPDPVHKDIATTLAGFVERYVHPDHKKRVEEFVNLDTLQERLRDSSFVDCEYLSLTENGWCRSRFLPVKWDDKGNVTHALLASVSVDDVKREELEQAKRIEDAMKLQLRVGEMLSRTHVLQTGIVGKRTGEMTAWVNGLFNSDGVEMTFEAAKELGGSAVHPDDRERFEREYDLGRIVETVEREGKCVLSYRIVVEGGKLVTSVHHYETLATDSAKMLMAVEDITCLVSGEACPKA